MTERGKAKAVTIEEFDEFMRRGGGGGPQHDGESPLAGLWKRWAMQLVGEKRDELENLGDPTLEQALELNALKKEFDRVEGDADAAYQAVRKYSPLLNSPVIKAVLG